MTNDNFKHVDPDAFHDRELTLHDCIAEKISVDKGLLHFYLPDGFWVTPHHKENDSGKTVRTGAATVSFSIEDIEDISVCVFTRDTWFWSRKTHVENWHMEQLIAAVNRGKCTFEFVTQYRSYYEQMWHCVIHSNRKPYYRECQLFLPKTKATFCWNNIRPEREW